MAFTKISAAAWRTLLRKLWGTPEYPAVAKRLEEAGILNREVEREKLLSAADRIFKRLGAQVTTESVPRDMPLARHPIRESFIRRRAQYAPGGGVDATSTAPLLSPDQMLPSARVPGRSIPGAPIFQIHEAFEGLRTAQKRPWQFASGGHASPVIVPKESQLLPFLPPKDIRHILRMRTGTGEREGFTRAGFTYGATPRVTKALGKKIEASTRAVLKERRRFLEASTGLVDPAWLRRFIG